MLCKTENAGFEAYGEAVTINDCERGGVCKRVGKTNPLQKSNKKKFIYVPFFSVLTPGFLANNFHYATFVTSCRNFDCFTIPATNSSFTFLSLYATTVGTENCNERSARNRTMTKRREKSDQNHWVVPYLFQCVRNAHHTHGRTPSTREGQCIRRSATLTIEIDLAKHT